MRATAPYQNEILSLLLRNKKPMSLRQISHNCTLTYNQVASCLLALKAKGMVRKVKVGVYEVTENAKRESLSPEAQIRSLKDKIRELETLINTLLMRK